MSKFKAIGEVVTFHKILTDSVKIQGIGEVLLFHKNLTQCRNLRLYMKYLHFTRI